MSDARKQTKAITMILVFIVIFCVVAGFSVALFEELSDTEGVQDYTLESVEHIEKLSNKDKRLKSIDMKPEQDEIVYLMDIRVTNQDTEEINYLSIEAQDQDGDYISCVVLDPYGSFDVGSRSVIPAGVSRNVPVVVVMSEEERNNTESIDFYRWDSEGDEKKVCTIFMDEILAETE